MRTEEIDPGTSMGTHSNSESTRNRVESFSCSYYWSRPIQRSKEIKECLLVTWSLAHDENFGSRGSGPTQIGTARRDRLPIYQEESKWPDGAIWLSLLSTKPHHKDAHQGRAVVSESKKTFAFSPHGTRTTYIANIILPSLIVAKIPVKEACSHLLWLQ